MHGLVGWRLVRLDYIDVATRRNNAPPPLLLFYDPLPCLFPSISLLVHWDDTLQPACLFPLLSAARSALWINFSFTAKWKMAKKSFYSFLSNSTSITHRKKTIATTSLFTICFVPFRALMNLTIFESPSALRRFRKCSSVLCFCTSKDFHYFKWKIAEPFCFSN